MAILKLNPKAPSTASAKIIRASFKELKRLVVHTNGCIRMLNTDHIEYLKADSNYCHIHLIGGEKLLVSKTMKNIASQLDHTFIKTHKSYIINLRYVHSYIARDAQIKMVSGDYVEISRSNKTQLHEIFQTH